jgi:aryl-alcohol dehydrogenase-like predicted oxidoreductase
VWSPLASGFLSGKYTRENLADPNNRYSGFDLLPFDKERGFAVVELLRTIARMHECSVAQVAIAWLLTRAGVTSVLLGASKVTQLDDNLGATSIVLGADELKQLDEATALSPVYPFWFAQATADQAMSSALDVESTR